MLVIGVIVARGGSRGIKGKNLVPLLGKPLLQWTCEQAKSAKRLDKIICSTDDADIAECAGANGIEVHDRPKNLASDTAATVEVIRDALRSYRGYDAVFTLQPTNPLRIPADIDGAIELLEANDGVDAIIGYSPVGERHPARMVYINEKQVITPVLRDFPPFTRRQDLPPCYLRNGAVYLTRVHAIEEGRIEGRRHLPYIIPAERCWNIDEPADIKVCETLLK